MRTAVCSGAASSPKSRTPSLPPLPPGDVRPVTAPLDGFGVRCNLGGGPSARPPPHPKPSRRRSRMPAHHRHIRWGLAVAAAVVVAACKDTTGPQAHLSDPAGLSSDLQTVSGVLLSPTFQSF